MRVNAFIIIIIIMIIIIIIIIIIIMRCWDGLLEKLAVNSRKRNGK